MRKKCHLPAIGLVIFALSLSSCGSGSSAVCGSLVSCVTPTATTTSTATPILTPTANVTPTPTNSPFGGNLVFNDSLMQGDRHGWDQAPEPYGTCTFTSSGYLVSAPANLGRGCFAHNQEAYFTDFTYEITMKIESGLLDGFGSAGLGFRLSSQGKLYEYSFGADGHYVFIGVNNTSFTSFDTLKAGKSAYFLQGENQSNTIAVQATGNSFKFFVDGQLIDSVIDPISRSDGGFIGVILGPGSANASVLFTNAKVWISN